MVLPRLTIDLTIVNPYFDPGGTQSYYIQLPQEVEVMTLNLNAGTMRVRNISTKSAPQDVSIAPFLEHYEIVKRG